MEKKEIICTNCLEIVIINVQQYEFYCPYCRQHITIDEEYDELLQYTQVQILNSAINNLLQKDTGIVVLFQGKKYLVINNEENIQIAKADDTAVPGTLVKIILTQNNKINYQET